MNALTVSNKSTFFLAMWNDIERSMNVDYEYWHSAVHIRERIEIPGFVRARRYSNENAKRQQYFVIYDVVDQSVLGSAEYLYLINNVTTETKHHMSAFRDFTRGGCAVVARYEEPYIGGAVRVWRFDSSHESTEDFVKLLKSSAKQLFRQSQVGTVTVGIVPDTGQSSSPNAERDFRERREPDGLFSAVMLAETRSINQAWELRLPDSVSAFSNEKKIVTFTESYALDLLELPSS